MHAFIKITVTIQIIFMSILCYSQDVKQTEAGSIFLNEIAHNISTYKSKSITLRLKLKKLDVVFEKIIFYDRNNHDIEFDLSDWIIKKHLANDMINLHEGMDYNVTFIVQNVGNLGQIIGELKGFKPVILESMPEMNKK